MKHIKSTFLMISVLVLGACSSTKKQEREKMQEVDNTATIKRDYEVRDASTNKRPTWVEDTLRWSEENGKADGKYIYFSYSTDPKVKREMACKLAKANVRADIASEISTFIQDQLGESVEGRASLDQSLGSTSMKEYVESTLAQQVQAMIYGASVRQTYWEKRQYLQSLGAPRDQTGYTCSVLVRMESKRLERTINRAENQLVTSTDDPSTRANVKKALSDVSENFVKAKKGQI